MPSVTYTAKRQIINGHSADTDYTISFGLSQRQKPVTIDKEQNVSIGGNVETILRKIVDFWDLTTTPIDAADRESWHEFLYSVSVGESFTLDLTDASPEVTYAVILDGTWSEAYPDPSLLYYQYSFRVRDMS